MRDYWLTQYILSAIGWGYVIVSLAALAAAVWAPRARSMKLMSALIVLAAASILPIQGYQEYRQRKQAAEEFTQRQEKSASLFAERCKSAGEKIYQTVDGVSVVGILRVRPKRNNFDDQYRMDDPYGRDIGGEGYISSFLRPAALNSTGYRFVDVMEPPSAPVRYELVQQTSESGSLYTKLHHVPVQGDLAKYGVDYEDISTPEDRAQWIAAGRLRVVELSTNRVVAERIGYLFDPRLGDSTGGRGPWEAAITCNGEDRKYGHTARFVMKVLKPSGGS